MVLVLWESLPCAFPSAFSWSAIKTCSQHCCPRDQAQGSHPALPAGMGRGARKGNWLLLQSSMGIKGTPQTQQVQPAPPKCLGTQQSTQPAPIFSFFGLCHWLIYLLSSSAAPKQRFHRYKSQRWCLPNLTALAGNGICNPANWISPFKSAGKRQMGSSSSAGKSCLQDERRAWCLIKGPLVLFEI